MRRSLLHVALASLAMLAALPGASAQTFYVATTGSDTTGDGSAGNEWATITHAVDTVPDGATVLVRPGMYLGRTRIDREFATGIVVRSEVPYRAQLRAFDEQVITCYYGTNITIEGFDIAHESLNTAALVIQVQDLLGSVSGAGPNNTDPVVRGIVFRDNVMHDSTNNDILKINNGAQEILVEGNMFYNQNGSDEHMDINSVRDVVIQDNVLFNDLPNNANDTGAFIIIKDSNDSSDSILGSHRITVKRNVFLGWQGSDGSPFVGVGEDGNPFHEGYDITVENNLMLGNSPEMIRAAFHVKGGRDITFRANTVAGDLPSRAYAARLVAEGSNPVNANVAFANNVWSDPTGTLGTEGFNGVDFMEAPPPMNDPTITLHNNLYWNGGQDFPTDPTEIVHYTDDAAGILDDPGLPAQGNITLPRFTGTIFADGSTTIRQAFVRLADSYGRPAAGSPVVDAADPTRMPVDDLLGNARGSSPDVGAYELVSSGGIVADFSGAPRSGAAPLGVQFTDLSTGSPTGWSWDFGDGGTSTTASPSHTYTAPGSYTVSLTVTDGSSTDTETKSGYVTVTGGAPVENFLSGRGRGLPNPNEAAVHSLGGVLESGWIAYVAGQWGTIVAAGDVDLDGTDEPITGPGPGPVYGPQVRGFRADGTPIAKINFFAYGTLRYGVNVASGSVDPDGYAEILTGAGPGEVFGPHVRGFNFDGGIIGAIAKINFFAYSTLRYGVNATTSDVDSDDMDEILTGPGPGVVFGAQVRGFNVDGGGVTAIGKINFSAFASATHGANVGDGDVEGDTFGEILVGRGPGAGNAAEVAGFDYDGSAVVAIPGYNVLLAATTFGAHPHGGDIDGDGIDELVASAGEDPAAPARVQSYEDGTLQPIATGTFDAFSGSYGIMPATGVLGF